MVLNEQKVQQLMVKYAQLEQQAAMMAQQLQAAQTPRPKLQ
jgi:outer membrane murein-binding lipoprotein Lpp